MEIRKCLNVEPAPGQELFIFRDKWMEKDHVNKGVMRFVVVEMNPKDIIRRRRLTLDQVCETYDISPAMRNALIDLE